MSGDLDAIVPDVAEAEARVAEAAAERRRLRAARSGSAERTSMRDVLVGAAESSSVTTVVVGNGRTHRVRLVAVGSDVVVAVPSDASGEAGRTLLLGLDAVRTVVVHRQAALVGVAGWAGSVGPVGPSPAAAMVHELHMGDILAQRLDARPRITAWVGTEQISGTLTSVGLDVVGISTEGLGETAYVRLDSTTEISVSVSSSL